MSEHIETPDMSFKARARHYQLRLKPNCTGNKGGQTELDKNGLRQC